ncbi:MAG TPA: hypothetical protein VNU46_09385 [Gemmatimonadaceae bacterium]|jgi:hypothetical protein|nr:hypothetical protein [Gemmatimonadaceae bacterium]
MWRIPATIACLAIPAIAMAQQHNDTGIPGTFGTQGLGTASASRVEIMALQQELRDRGCSPGAVTGQLNAQTRHAMACARKDGLATGDSPKAMLQSLNVGFSGEDTTETLAFLRTGTAPSPSIGGMTGGNSTGGLGGSIGTPTTGTGGSSPPPPPTPPPTPTSGGQTPPSP